MPPTTMFLRRNRVAAKLRAIHSYLDTDAIPWKRIIITLLCAVYLFETYVMMRQYRLYSLTTPPKVLEGHVSHEDFLKSQQYGRDMAHSVFLKKFNEFMMRMLMIVFNGHAHIWAASTALLRRLGMTPSEPKTSAVYLIFLSLTTLPGSIVTKCYKHFVVKESEGDTRRIWIEFVAEFITEQAIVPMMEAPLYALYLKVLCWLGIPTVVYLGLSFFLDYFMGWLFPLCFTKMAPLPEGQLRDRITALTAQLNFPLKYLYAVVESDKLSNFVYYGNLPGYNLNMALPGKLIELWSTGEMEAVLAHKLGHWFYSLDIKERVVMMLNTMFWLYVYTLLSSNASFLRAFGFEGPHAVARVSRLPVLINMDLVGVLLKPVDGIMRFVFNPFFRQFEYQADRCVFHTNAASPSH